MNKLLILCSALALSACVVPHPYTSTEYQKYKQSDLKVPNQPYTIRLEGEFERNGKSFPKANPALTKAAKIALNGTKIVTVDPQAQNSLKIHANNIANIGGAVGNGIKTGLTFGLAGSTVQDYYQFYCSYSDGKKELNRSEFNHAIVTTFGLTSTPKELTPHSNLDQAFISVTKDIVVNCLGDLQNKGFLLPEAANTNAGSN